MLCKVEILEVKFLAVVGKSDKIFPSKILCYTVYGVYMDVDYYLSA